MGSRKSTDEVNRSYGPRKVIPKHPRTHINIDTSSDEFPDLPSRSSTSKNKQKSNKSISTLTQDQSDVISTLQAQIQELTQLQQNTQRQLQQQQEVLVKLQDQVSNHMQQQTDLLKQLVSNQLTPPSLQPPPLNPKPVQHVPPLPAAADDLGITDFMDDTTPGENKRNNSSDTSSPTTHDFQIFMNVINELDKQRATSSADTVTELTQNKNYIIGMKNDFIRIYNQTFKLTSDWKISKQKKNKPNTRSSSLKQASNECGPAQQSS